MENIILASIIALCVITYTSYAIVTLNKTKDGSGNKTPDPIYPTIGKIKYTDELLEFIRKLSIQLSVIKFKEFIDEHEIDKITKSQIQKLVTETASMVNSSFSKDPIDFDNLLVSREFLDEYIVQTSIMAIKDLLERSVTEITQ